MRTFKLVVAYDGTDFRGWQRQPRERTVQGALEASLREVLKDDTVTVAGAGRTDAGVHARGQVASFQTVTPLPARSFAPLLNARLPADVRVCAASEEAALFHARHAARARRYAYHLLRDEDLLRERFAWRPPGPLDPAQLCAATRVLEGRHDFAAFQSAGSTVVPTECRIVRATWCATAEGLRLDIIADRFLYRMVRNIVGTALQAAASGHAVCVMRAIRDARDRRRAAAPAPARGLSLEQVFYGGRA